MTEAVFNWPLKEEPTEKDRGQVEVWTGRASEREREREYLLTR